MFDLIVRDGSVVFPDGVKQCSLGIADGRVAGLFEGDAGVRARETIEAGGKLVLPGLVDAHVHFREPGLVHKEGFASGSRAAAAGGVTTVMVMPTDNPMTTTPELFLEKKELATSVCHVDYALQAGLGPDTSHVRALADLGAISFEIFLADLAPPMLMAEAAELVTALAAVREVNGVAGITPGDDSIVREATKSVRAANRADPLAFARSRPPVAEALGLARTCLAAADTGAQTHIRQVSCAKSVAVLRALAPAGMSAEVTPHNLLLEEQELARQGSLAKVVPPLRLPADMAAVRTALRDGLITMVATDHAPHSQDEKRPVDDEIWTAPGGFPGVQTFLPLMLRLVGDGVLNYAQLVGACCTEPARRFGLYPRKGILQLGADADLVLVDPTRSFTIRNEDQVSKARLTPFHGWTAPATPELALLRGVPVMRDGYPCGQPTGRFVRP